MTLDPRRDENLRTPAGGPPAGEVPPGSVGRRSVLGAGAALLLAGCTAAPAGTSATSSGLRTKGAASAAAPSGTTASATASSAASGQAVATQTASQAAPRPLSQLAARMSGRLYLPGAAGYDAVRLTENPRYDSARPLGVARVASAKDVSAVLAFAQENDVPLALRSGGHSYPGWSSGGAAGSGMQRSLVVDVRGMNSIKASGTSVTVGAGTALAPLYGALAAKGRGIAGGSCATVGIAGLTLGGGVGVLTRAHGLTSDALRSAQIVTPDAKVRTVDARHDPELFWALRGGGGGHLGVVTSLTFSTFAAPTIKSFFYQWPLSAAQAVIPAWQAWAPTADPRLWSTLKLLGGASRTAGAVVLLSGTWVGPGAPPVAAFLKKVPRPSVSSSRTRSYGQAMAGYAGCAAVPAKQCHTGSGGALQREAFAATSHVAYAPLRSAGVLALVTKIKQAQRSGLKEAGISIDALGGAVSTVAPGATAFVHRKALATVQYTATYTGSRAAEAASFVRGFRAAMVPSWGNHAYVNYADATLKHAATAYFGANAPRLAATRKRYDPRGLLTQPQAY